MQDLAEVEEAVGQHVWPLEALGAPHGMLRALRQATVTCDFAGTCPAWLTSDKDGPLQQWQAKVINAVCRFRATV